MFWVIKTQHEERDRDLPRKVEGRFFQDGKNVAKTCSVFLHKNVQHAVDEWWISWRKGAGQRPTRLRFHHEATKQRRRRSEAWIVQTLPYHPRRLLCYVDEALSWPGGPRSDCLLTREEKRVTTEGARGAKAEMPMPAIPVFFVLLELFVVIPLGLVWRAGLV